MSFGTRAMIDAHAREDDRRFSDLHRDFDALRNDLNAKHVENQSANAALVRRIDLHQEEAAKAASRIQRAVIALLIAVLGAILAQSFHFRVSMSDLFGSSPGYAAPPPPPGASNSCFMRQAAT